MHHSALVLEGLRILPVRHQLIHVATVEIRFDRSFEVVDESVHLIVRRRPVEVALLVRGVAIK
jgi:hypothetical protein